MRDIARSFLIDLVAISAHLRIAVFNGKKPHMFDIAKATGLTVEHIENVLVKALDTDFRDEQLELLTSQIVFNDSQERARKPSEVMLYEAPYPPLRIVAALTGSRLEELKRYHANPWSRSLIRTFIDTQFTQAVFEWVQSNIDNALAVGMEEFEHQNNTNVHIEPQRQGTAPMRSSGHGMSLTVESVKDNISRYMGLKPDDVNIHVM
ncbi:hypothetical protein D3C87_1181360 [compost metagenome]